MTRKDYVAIAEVIADAKDRFNMDGAGQYIAGRLADMMAADNPSFDRERFLKAAGVQS